LREDVKTYLALKEIEADIKEHPESPLAGKRGEVQQRLHKIQQDFSYNVRRMYHTLQVGARRIDLGQPVTGAQAMGSWYWQELTSMDIGLIVENLHYRTLVNKLLQGNEQVATGVILEQFYKNTDLPVPASADVVTRAIQLGVQDGAFGLAMSDDGEIAAGQLRYRESLPLSVIAYEPGFFLVSQAKCESLLEEQRRQQEAEQRHRDAEQAGREGEIGIGDGRGVDTEAIATQKDTPGTEPPPAPTSYKRVRLVVADIPASRIADVNRGIFMPLSSSVKDLKFTLEIDVTSEEGITQATLENKIKETIRQIGANLRHESRE
jgi:hypothetical protein